MQVGLWAASRFQFTFETLYMNLFLWRLTGVTGSTQYRHYNVCHCSVSGYKQTLFKLINFIVEIPNTFSDYTKYVTKTKILGKTCLK